MFICDYCSAVLLAEADECPVCHTRKPKLESFDVPAGEEDDHEDLPRNTPS